MKSLFHLFFITLIFSCLLFRIEVKAEQTNKQVTFLILPSVKEGEDIRTVLSDNPDKAKVFSKIIATFDNEGIPTINYRDLLKEESIESVTSDNNHANLKSTIISSTDADIIVETEIDIIRSGITNSVQILLTAYDSSTGQQLSRQAGTSMTSMRPDFDFLGSQAINDCIEPFVFGIRHKLDEKAQNGQ